MKDLIKSIGTQAEVARATGASPRTVQWWASGRRLPDVADFAELLALAGVVSVHVDSGSRATVLRCYSESDCGDPSLVLTVPKGRMGGDDA